MLERLVIIPLIDSSEDSVWSEVVRESMGVKQTSGQGRSGGGVGTNVVGRDSGLAGNGFRITTPFPVGPRPFG